MYSDYPGFYTPQPLESHNGQWISHKSTTFSTPKLPDEIRFSIKFGKD